MGSKVQVIAKKGTSSFTGQNVRRLQRRPVDTLQQPADALSSLTHSFAQMSVWPAPRPSLQRKNTNEQQESGLMVTEEIIDLSQDSDLAKIPNLLENNPAGDVSKESADGLVQTKSMLPPSIQLAGDQPETPRRDIVFMMGSSGGFFVAAKKFFKMHHPEAEIIPLSDLSLAGIFAKLRAIASADNPIGNLYIVSHANVDGTLSFGLTKKDKDKKTTFGELKNALANSADLFTLNGGIDGKTKVHIKGCNIGRNAEMLNALDEAFGKDVEVDAPTHKQGYEFHSEGKGKNLKVVSTEYFNTYNVEFVGRVDKSSDELIAAFKEKYAELDFSDQDWEIAVLGTVKQGKKVAKAAAEQKKEVDERFKSALAELDKTDPEYKNQVKYLKTSTKAEKTTIDSQAADSKKTKVAKGSKGASKKVITPFTASLFADKRAPVTEAEILKMAPLWFSKARKQGWIFTSASLTIERVEDRDHFTYTVNGKNKESSAEFTYELEMAAFPATDEEAKTLANLQLEKYLEAHPDFAISRSEMFDWRISRDKKKGKETIQAFLEMTIYTIDLDLRSDDGAKIDPAAKTGEDFYYGESDVTASP